MFSQAPRRDSQDLYCFSLAADMTAMIEALSCLGPHGPAARDEQSCTITTLCMLLVFAWALSKLVLMCSWHLLVKDP